MAHSGARGGVEQIRQLAGMRGLMAKPSGQIIETPIKANFREGLSVLEYFSSHARRPQGPGRHGPEDGRLRLPDAQAGRRGPERRHHHARLRHHPGHHQGRRLQGRGDRAAAVRVDPRPGQPQHHHRPITGEVIVEENEMITWEQARKIEQLGLDKILVRSPMTCQAPLGVCRLCYGMDLATGNLVEEGMAVGIIAAQSIGEPGTQLTMRTFHIGGVGQARSSRRASIKAKKAGTVKFERINAVTNDKGERIALTRNGEI